MQLENWGYSGTVMPQWILGRAPVGVKTSLICHKLFSPYPLLKTLKVCLASIFHTIYFLMFLVYRKKMVSYESAFGWNYITAGSVSFNMSGTEVERRKKWCGFSMKCFNSIGYCLLFCSIVSSGIVPNTYQLLVPSLVIKEICLCYYRTYKSIKSCCVCMVIFLN